MLRITFLLLLVALVGGGVLYYKVKTQEETILSLKTQKSILEDDLSEAKEEINKLEEANDQLEDRLDQINALSRGSHSSRSKPTASLASYKASFK